MLQGPGDLIFASSLTAIILALFIVIQRPGPNPTPPRHIPPPPPSPPTVFPAAVNIKSPYDEDTIVALINELYSLYIALAYLRPSDIIRPDSITGRHKIHRTLCRSIGIDDAVVSLMERIPYMTGSHTDPRPCWEPSNHPRLLVPSSWAYSFLVDQDIIASRDPDFLDEFSGSEPLRPDYLLSHDVALSANMENGMTLILDTNANTVRLTDKAKEPNSVNPKEFVQERPEDYMHYRNYYTQDAPSYLRDLIMKIRSLEIIP